MEPRNCSELRRTDLDLGSDSLEADSSLEVRNRSLCHGNTGRARVQTEGSRFIICSDMKHLTALGPPSPMTISLGLVNSPAVGQWANSLATRREANQPSPVIKKNRLYVLGLSILFLKCTQWQYLFFYKKRDKKRERERGGEGGDDFKC